MIRDVAMLGLETSTPVGGVAVGRDGRALVEVALAAPVRQAESALPAIAFVLERAGLDRSELAGIVIGGGPGSFTGLRIAAATGKGLARALEVPLFAYSGLLALAAAYRGERPVCALFDARRGSVYGACYRVPTAPEDGGGRDIDIETLAGPVVEDAAALVDRLRPHDPLYVGPGAQKNAEALRAAGASLVTGAAQWPPASSLLWLARWAPDAGRVAQPNGWEPDYVRASSAERSVAG